MEQATRDNLQNVVTSCRKLLEESISQQLKGQFGIRAGNRDAVQIEEEVLLSKGREVLFSISVLLSIVCV